MANISVTITETPIAVSIVEDGVAVSIPNGATIAATVSAATGPTGDTGPQGVAGPGVPSGGTTGQRLAKASNVDYNTQWEDPTSLPAGTDKQIQYNDGGTLAGNDNFRFDKNNNSVNIGPTGGAALPTNPLHIVGTADSYIQTTQQNTTEGEAASSDLVLLNDQGTDTQHYIDLGKNSSIYDVAEYSATKANDGYLFDFDGDLIIGAATTGKTVQIAAGGITSDDIIATFSATGLALPEGYTVTNRPEIFFGTGSPPSATGLADGSLFFKYA